MVDDDAYQLLARAVGFLEAARVVVDNSGNKASLRAPVAHLIAHGLEVLMKHVVLMQGGTNLEVVRQRFGHDIGKLWQADELCIFRENAENLAGQAYSYARASGSFQDRFDENPIELLNNYMMELSRLHTNASNFALRYVASAREMAPFPLLLLDTFEPLANSLALEYSRSEKARTNG